MNQKRIYLDANATTGLDKKVLEAVIQELQQSEGNPSSLHLHGQQARQRLNQYRQTIARYLGVPPSDLIFTAGGTEGANMLLHGFLSDSSKGHLITSNVEHSCVYKSSKEFEKKGYAVSFLPAGEHGAIQPEAVQAAITSRTSLIALMAVNNETGVKTDWHRIAAIAKAANIPFMVDGVALLGKESFTIPPGVTAMFFSGHKLHAPKGVGVVFCRQPQKLAPVFLGGSQEFNRRAGTENLPGIAGLAKAIEILQDEQDAAQKHMQKMRNKLEQGLQSQLTDLSINGHDPRVVNTTNISFLGLDGESLLINLDMAGVSVSHGSACSSGALEPSRILLNMGIPLEQARSAIRFSVSRFNTEEEIDEAINIIVKTVQGMRQFRQRRT